MTVALDPTRAGTCLGCGEVVDPDASFCPSCGTRLVADRPMPVETLPQQAEQVDRMGHSANLWVAAALAAALLLVLAVGILLGRVGTGAGTEVVTGGGDDADGPAAEAMDAYRPLGEAWADKQEHVLDEADGDDPNGLAVAAEDARLWIDVNRPDLVALARTDGAAAPLYQALVATYDERATVLAGIEATATAGGSGTGAAADDVAILDPLDTEADALVCDIAEVMREEGDDPGDHISMDMRIAC
jgi:hypothetical protein